ncbi:Ppx/GppA family phosphatase [Novosphingobium colocasiae]|uniref:Ppx/GppA phosphatase family protein n=1 Tax=Novosphingobium colocasiae TaxID=1256513 RepID=UPI0035AF0B7A
MAEHDPPAAKVSAAGRKARRSRDKRRKAARGKARKSASGAPKPEVRPNGGTAGETAASPREPQQAALSPPQAPPERTAAPVRAAAFEDRGPVASANGLSGRPSGPGPRQAYAAIDLGTNNCRLLIARPSGDNFTVIDAFSRVVRLGEGVAQTGRLSDAAMERTLSALKVCADKLMRRNVFLARSVATEACRRASNGAEFIERVRRETGIALNVISAREEARLAVLGCHVLLEDGLGPAMIFDIGGGSTELVLIESTGTVPRILDWQSVPWGVVSLSESCGQEGATEAERLARYRHMRELVAESFAAFARRIEPSRDGAAEGGPLRLLGTSGTVTTLASLHLELPQYDRRLVDGLVVPAASMRAISTRLSSLDLAGRRDIACIGRERADLVVAGCAILETILDLWPADRLGVADRGIREGILRGLIAAHGGAGDQPPRTAGGAFAAAGDPS